MLSNVFFWGKYNYYFFDGALQGLSKLDATKGPVKQGAMAVGRRFF